MSKAALAIGVVPLAGVVLLIGAITVLAGGTEEEAASSCSSKITITVDPETVPDTTIAGYGHSQLVNAAHIIEAGKALNLTARDQTIGVMTAMGESTLRVVDYGDDAGPDSRGLFQQRDNGAWGSYADRMDPSTSATNFFKAMMKIKDRDSLRPTIVAHRTQRNRDPEHYTPFWTAAIDVVEGISGTKTTLTTTGQIKGCGNASDGESSGGEPSKTGWTEPGKGPITSSYGNRFHPTLHTWRLHAGTDLDGGGCGGPIYAANDGTVISAGFDSIGTGIIVIDHGGGTRTAYLHMYASGILVAEGDKVAAGDLIGRVGSTGRSTGCHLHFEVRIGSSTTDPVPWMKDHGITLGALR